MVRANIGRAAYNKCDDAFYSQGIHIKEERSNCYLAKFLQTLFELHYHILANLFTSTREGEDSSFPQAHYFERRCWSS